MKAKFIIVSSIMCILTACDPYELYLTIDNPDMIPLVVCTLYEDYSDVVPNNWINDYSNCPPSRFNIFIAEGLGSQRDVFNRFVPDGTFSIRIAHPDTVMKYSWKKILEDNLLMYSYDLTLDDLIDLNWEITICE